MKLQTPALLLTTWISFTARPSTHTSALPSNGIVPFETRAHWMRLAQHVVTSSASSPCPWYPFASAIVNHTARTDRGDLICTGLNGIMESGNAVLHGEIAAIDNCTRMLQDPNGRFRLSPHETIAAFADLTLYTTAESCIMCAAAIRLAGFKEYVYGTPYTTSLAYGWEPFEMPSAIVFRISEWIYPRTSMLGSVLSNETDGNIMWQYNPAGPCPKGCARSEDGACKVRGA